MHLSVPALFSSISLPLVLILSVLCLFPSTSSALNIVLSNDDGWAERNIRTFFYKLTSNGHNVVLSAPAEDKSGKPFDGEPKQVDKDGCEYKSCPPRSPAIGFNESEPRFNYVNS